MDFSRELDHSALKKISSCFVHQLITENTDLRVTMENAQLQIWFKLKEYYKRVMAPPKFILSDLHFILARGIWSFAKLSLLQISNPP